MVLTPVGKRSVDIHVDISRSVLKRGEIQTFTLALNGAVFGDNIYIH